MFKRLWLWVSKLLKSQLTWAVLLLAVYAFFYYFGLLSTIFDYLPPSIVDFFNRLPQILVGIYIAWMSSLIGSYGTKKQTEKLIKDNRRLNKKVENLILEVESRLNKRLTTMSEQQSKPATYTTRGR